MNHKTPRALAFVWVGPDGWWEARGSGRASFSGRPFRATSPSLSSIVYGCGRRSAEYLRRPFVRMHRPIVVGCSHASPRVAFGDTLPGSAGARSEEVDVSGCGRPNRARARSQGSSRTSSRCTPSPPVVDGGSRPQSSADSWPSVVRRRMRASSSMVPSSVDRSTVAWASNARGRCAPSSTRRGLDAAGRSAPIRARRHAARRTSPVDAPRPAGASRWGNHVSRDDAHADAAARRCALGGGRHDGSGAEVGVRVSLADRPRRPVVSVRGRSVRGRGEDVLRPVRRADYLAPLGSAARLAHHGPRRDPGYGGGAVVEDRATTRAARL